MKASRLPRPVGSSRLLPAFSPAELARKRLRHLSGSSGSSAALPCVPTKAQRPATPPPAPPPPAPPHDAAARPAAERPLKSSTPAAVLQGIASADTSVPYPQLASLGARPKHGKRPLSPTDIGYASADVSQQFPAPLPQRPRRKRDKPRVEGAVALPSSPLPSTSAAASAAPAPPATSAPRTARPAVGVARPQPVTCEFPAFRVPAQQGFETSYDAVAALEDEHTHLRMKNVPGKDGSSVLLPLDSATFTTLDALASDPAGVTLLKIDADTQLHKGVVMGYPLRLPLSLLRRHQQVEEATRCISSRTKQETQQVVISIRGPLPAQLDLGNWGVFYTRPFTPEPLRCYRCQRFGHHRASCSRPPVCGICSAAHATQQCLDKFKARQEVTSKCPNCGKGHHAWNPSCPARLQRVHAGRERQVQWVREQQQVALVPAPPGTFVWGRQGQHKKPSGSSDAAAADEDFPPLQRLPPKTAATQASTPPQPCPPPGSISVTKTMLIEYGNEITSAVAEIVLKAAGVNIDLAAFQAIMARANEKIVEKLFSSLRP